MDSGTLTWLGHATFLLTTPAGDRVLIDPYLVGNPSCPESFHAIDDIALVLCTHGHGDHVADAVAVANRSGAAVACIVELASWLQRQGAAETIGFNKGGRLERAGVAVTMTHALHSSSTPDGAYAGEAAGFVIELEDGYTCYFAGDTCLFGDMALIGEMHQPDLAILPIGGFFTMDPQQAAHAVRLVGAPEVLGAHYGTYPPLTGTPDLLRAQLHRLGLASSTVVHELTPGGTLPLRAGITTA